MEHFHHLLKKDGLTPGIIRLFQQIIYDYYRKHGRQLPWRATDNAYCICVSEIMLQQTQVERVIEKYKKFIKVFPDFFSLSQAHLSKVLEVWQGLGYNRRAIALKKIARIVETQFQGNLPSRVDILETLPGIGHATACAISTFAFHKANPFLETNTRRVFIHFFFYDRENIKDKEIYPLVEKSIDASNPREWYYALMDYGVMLKKYPNNPNRRSAHYQRPAPFKDSDRQIRGLILKALLKWSELAEEEIVRELGSDPERVKKNLIQLQEEGFIKEKGEKFVIG